MLAFSFLLGISVSMNLLGMAVGHIYYFMEDIFPQQPGGWKILNTPHFLDFCVTLPQRILAADPHLRIDLGALCGDRFRMMKQPIGRMKTEWTIFNRSKSFPVTEGRQTQQDNFLQYW